MSRSIESLQPKVQIAANLAIEDLRFSGVLFYVSSTLRTTDEQIALYAQGRESLEQVNRKRQKAGMKDIGLRDNSYTVTNCDGVLKKSEHQSGMALDIVPVKNGVPYWPSEISPEWMKISKVMKKYGFEWGGDWTKFRDLPHYQYIGGK